ncbi:rCG62223 [Rattus norvegicus]|uniref:RCG62222 n=1 Tax=Rattus norvegicus TaxID=10116 RepID=A6HA58_RAT|nr:rCG62222 [Rattus norvegicus]EDM02914.1 rCG62223 [Rattus norvegicus]
MSSTEPPVLLPHLAVPPAVGDLTPGTFFPIKVLGQTGTDWYTVWYAEDISTPCQFSSRLHRPERTESF